MEGLTARQRDILQFIVESSEQKHYPPSIREIGVKFGIRSTNGVNDHLRALERKGYLTRTDQTSRSLVVTAKGRGCLGISDAASETRTVLRLPVVSGITRGSDLLDPANVSETIAVDASLLPGSLTERFAVRMCGDGMIGAGIFSGDLLFARRQDTARPGDVVVACLSGDLCVRRYFPEGDRIRLEPANDSLRPVYVEAARAGDFVMLGVAIGLNRKFS